MVSSEIVNEGKSNKIFRKTRKKYPKWTKRVVKVRRITKVIKGGKKLRFGAVVVIGNGNGQVGLGVGKADDVIEAVKKAVNDGKRELISIPLTKNYSIPYVVTGKYGAANVIIKPAVAGSGVLAGGSVRTRTVRTEPPAKTPEPATAGLIITFAAPYLPVTTYGIL